MLKRVENNEFIIVSHGMLGYGFPKESLESAIEIGIDVLAIDAGSTDPGPYYLGSGQLFGAEEMMTRDLELLLDAQTRTGAKIVIGSAGGAGTNTQLEKVTKLLRDCIASMGVKRRVALIQSEIDKSDVIAALDEGRIEPFETGRQLERSDIDEATHIVAQIGVEPILAALAKDPDIILCGRAWDPGNVAALAIARGYDPGLCIHAGKILECGAQAALPVEGSDLLLGRIRHDSFIVEPCASHKKCTVESVAAHTLYEKTDPVLLPGPGGRSDLRSSSFNQLDDRRVIVKGSRFETAPVYKVKIEGARLAGHRQIVIAGIRDPLLVAQIEEVQKGVMEKLVDIQSGKVEPSDYSVRFHRYGLDGVMGSLEPVKKRAHEIGLVIDVVGKTREIARMVATTVRALLMHWGYRGRIATAGNLALPFSPAEFAAGEVYEFNIYHLMAIDDPVALFPYEIEVMS
jgi:hypothetical protein